jgi:hypothetical protein
MLDGEPGGTVYYRLRSKKWLDIVISKPADFVKK